MLFDHGFCVTLPQQCKLSMFTSCGNDIQIGIVEDIYTYTYVRICMQFVVNCKSYQNQKYVAFSDCKVHIHVGTLKRKKP